jgi:hypothetical protein
MVGMGKCLKQLIEMRKSSGKLQFGIQKKQDSVLLPGSYAGCVGGGWGGSVPNSSPVRAWLCNMLRDLSLCM